MRNVSADALRVFSCYTNFLKMRHVTCFLSVLPKMCREVGYCVWNLCFSGLFLVGTALLLFLLVSFCCLLLCGALLSVFMFPVIMPTTTCSYECVCLDLVPLFRDILLFLVSFLLCSSKKVLFLRSTGIFNRWTMKKMHL